MEKIIENLFKSGLNPNGEVVDAKTGKTIYWNRKKVVPEDMLDGFEFKKVMLLYHKGMISRDQFYQLVENPGALHFVEE